MLPSGRAAPVSRQRVARARETLGAEVFLKELDVRSEDSVVTFVDAVRAQWGPVDILVNFRRHVGPSGSFAVTRSVIGTTFWRQISPDPSS